MISAVTQWLRAGTELVEDLRSVPRAHSEIILVCQPYPIKSWLKLSNCGFGEILTF